MLRSSLSLCSTISASFFPALFQHWKRWQLLCQKPRVMWRLPGSFHPPGILLLQKLFLIPYGILLQNTIKEEAVMGEEVTLFLVNLNLLCIFPSCLARSPWCPTLLTKASQNEMKNQKSTEKKPNPNHCHSPTPQQFHGTAPKTSH